MPSSHLDWDGVDGPDKKVAPCVDAGSYIIFDYRLRHRGPRTPHSSIPTKPPTFERATHHKQASAIPWSCTFAPHDTVAGLGNRTKSTERPLLYLTYVRPWCTRHRGDSLRLAPHSNRCFVGIRYAKPWYRDTYNFSRKRYADCEPRHVL
jgi:hypothetical protein